MTETERYRRDGHVALPALFPVEILHLFYNQLQADIDGGPGSMRRFAMRGPLLRREAVEVHAHQYPPMRSFLWGLTPRIAAATGCDLLPTYAYFRLYRQGDICRVHSDRLACEHSVSLTLAYAEDRPWALAVAAERSAPQATVTDDFAGGRHASIAMRPGDAVLYQGIHHRHGRPTGNPNSWSAHLFLHWVDRAGPYRDEAFDRPMLARVAAAQGAPAAGAPRVS